MPDNISATPGSGITLATKDIGGVQYAKQIQVDETGAAIAPLTDTQLRATPVPVSGTVGVSGTVPVSGTFWQATQPVSGPLTDVQLRASAVPVSISAGSTVALADVTATGTITTQNLAGTGTATAGSAVEISTTGKSTVAVQVEGTYTGALTVQGRVNATGAWVTLSGGSVLYSIGGGVYSSNTIASGVQGIFLCDCAGFTAIRFTALAAVTGTATLNLRATSTTTMLMLDGSLPAGTASLGTVGLNAGTQAIGSLTATTALIGDVGIQARASATGAASIFKVQSAATTNAAVVKASAGRVLGWHFTNTSAATKVVHMHNLSAPPTVGTSVPAYNIAIPPNGYVETELPMGIAHTTGISCSITGGLADLDATAVAANDVIGAIYFA